MNWCHFGNPNPGEVATQLSPVYAAAGCPCFRFLSIKPARLPMAAKFNFGKLLVGVSPGALISATPEVKRLYWLKGVQSMFGHTRDEAVPKPLECLITPEIRSKK
jgi:hypothetical protein